VAPGGQSVLLDHPALKVGIRMMGEQWPRAVPFEAMWSEVRVRMARAGLATHALGDHDRRRLANFLLQGTAQGWVELHSHVPHFVREPGERPAATALARRQAADRSTRVTNLRHQQVELSRFDRHLLALLDGQRTQPALVEALSRLVAEGTLAIKGAGPAPLDPAGTQAIVVDSTHKGLQRLASLALLVA
jgi:methyltransferase-like protein